MAYIFDGPNRLIILSTGTINISTVEMYSAWKQWITLSDNTKYLPAFKVVGGDPTTGGNSITPYFFLDNGWKVRPQEANHTLDVNGILLTTDDSDPFKDTIGNWRVKIKSIVPIYAESVLSSGGTSSVDVASIWNYSNRTLTQSVAADVDYDLIATRVWNNVNRTLTQSVAAEVDLTTIPAAVWSYISRELTVAAGLTTTQEQILNAILDRVNTLNNVTDGTTTSELYPELKIVL